MKLNPGDRLEHFEIISYIAKGGMGEVWKARDTRLLRDVAIKISHEEFSERFIREAQVVSRLNHPNICTLYDIGPNYLVMEFIDGVPLRGPLPVEKTVEYAAQILDGLDTAHQQGIAHCDLKPSNIFVTKQGIKLLDFGAAKHTMTQPFEGDTQFMTKVGHIAGTLQYMAPELLGGMAANARSDIFSMGCVIYEMLTGAPVFPELTAATVAAAILEREPKLILTVPSLDRIIRACLVKDHQQRFQTAVDLRRALIWGLETTAGLVSPASPHSSSYPLLDFREMNITAGHIEDRYRSAEEEVRICGNDCKTAIEAKFRSVKELLDRDVKIKVLCVNPESPAASMLPLIDPRFPSLEMFKTSQTAIKSVLEHLSSKYPSQFEYRYLPIPPAFGLFIVDPDRPAGLRKVELYASQPWHPTGSRPNMIIEGEKWRRFFLQQWQNYWELSDPNRKENSEYWKALH
jgi:serine/threonine protein kinase